MDKYLEANRALWDEWTGINYRSDFYKVEAFKAGQNRLRDYEMEEIGPVEGKTLLHLQCHFGLDTLSWARLGAQVTGADFSSEAIERARALAATGLRVEFLHEFTFCEWPVSFLLAGGDGRYRLPAELDGKLPLFFSLRARKPPAAV